MFKPAGNPMVEALTKSHKKRSINLGKLKVVKKELTEHIVTRLCCWCAVGKLNHGAQRYCCRSCRDSATAWAYPQKEEGLNFLLIRQNFKCATCQFDYVPIVEQCLKNGYVYDKPDDYRIKISFYLMKRIKSKSPPERRPEVDHILAIHRGGASLGLENHQILCFTCHKAKTKVDNSGPRKVK